MIDHGLWQLAHTIRRSPWFRYQRRRLSREVQPSMAQMVYLVERVEEIPPIDLLGLLGRLRRAKGFVHLPIEVQAEINQLWDDLQGRD